MPKSSAHKKQTHAPQQHDVDIRHRKPSASTSASASASSAAVQQSSDNRWKSVRPWKPPEDLPVPSTSTSHISQPSSSETVPLSEQADTTNEENELLAELLDESKGCLKLEVIDVSSTSVALAILYVPSRNLPSRTNSSNLLSASTSHQPEASTSRRTSNASRRRSTSNASAKSISHHPSASNTNVPPAISIKLNSVPWPHVVHSDPAFLENATSNSDGETSSDTGPDEMSTTIVVYNLEPGKEYEVELDVVEQGQKSEALSVSPSRSNPSSPKTGDESRSKFTTTTAEPDGPPPPYSSHDPSSTPSNDARPQVSTTDATAALTSSEDSSSGSSTPPVGITVTAAPSQPQPQITESQLTQQLKQMKQESKQAEQSLQSSISHLKRVLEKSNKEDLRVRQRISTLEETTRKIKESLVEDAEELEVFSEETGPMEEEEQEWFTRVESLKIKIATSDTESRTSLEADETMLKQLQDQLEELVAREEGLHAENIRYQRDVLPDLNLTLQNIETELKRYHLGQFNAVEIPNQPITRSAFGSLRGRKAQQQHQQMQQHQQQHMFESYFPPPNPIASTSSSNASARVVIQTSPQQATVSPPTAPAVSGMSGIASKFQNRRRTGSDSSGDKGASNASGTSSFVPGLFRKSSDSTRTASQGVATNDPNSAPAAISVTPIAPIPEAPTAPASGNRFLASLRKRSSSNLATSPSLGSLNKDSDSIVEEPKTADKDKENSTHRMSWTRVVGGKKNAA